ncbi:amino acid adenylation domain-containing protein [Rhizobium leguminosarum]|uniref:amino acid adenylation domain-containing protein n=1 Tax=Rhizobium leguminosarum TaxID=384 RepID=UPI003ECE64AF
MEAQVARTPDAEAISFSESSLTYIELDQHSNKCARYLRRLGVGPDVVVGVLMERSIDLPVALLAILKAGGAYLPLDPNYPTARLNFLLEDAGVSVILTQPKFKTLVPDFKGTACTVNDCLLLDVEATPLEPISSPEDLAYVIYTSGSTGRPKGCMLSHRAICNRLAWMQDTYVLKSNDRVLQKTPFTFDVSVWELFWPLIAGATMVLAAPQGHKDTRYLVDTIRRQGITVCHFVPSMLRFFLNDDGAAHCHTLHDVFVSGEALSFSLMKHFIEKLPARLHNLYGPTEAAVDVSYWQCEERPDGKTPIGRAISNIELYVLDEAGQKVPIGATGELYISGVGLARGYLNRPELTLERFVSNPFGRVGDRMYRTGDQVRELIDGNIEFLGRNDFQVKVRGLRVELGEIETQLKQYPGVKEAVVMVRGGEDGDPKLVAYLEVAGRSLASDEIRGFIRDHLPDYMIPNIVVPLNQLPVTAHGKLDRDGLPWPVVGDSATISPPTVDHGATIDGIAGCVAKVLKRDVVEATDDLFDLGATSLSLMRIAELVREEYGVAVPIDVFLNDPTIKNLANYIMTDGLKEESRESPPVSRSTRPAEQSNILNGIAGCVAKVLKRDVVEATDDLFDLGATSLSLMRIAELVREEYGVAVPIDVFLNDPTIKNLANYIMTDGLKEESRESPPVSRSTRPAEQSNILNGIAGCVAKVLKRDVVEATDDLFDLGATSLSLMRIAELVREEYGVAVPIDVFLNDPTIKNLANYIMTDGLKEESRESPQVSRSTRPAEQSNILNGIAGCVAKVLKRDAVEATDDLFDLGATSLSLMRIAELVREEYGVAVPIDVFLNDPTINNLANYIINNAFRHDASFAQRGRANEIVNIELCETAPILLDTVHFKLSAYLETSTYRHFREGPIPFEDFSGWLALLRGKTEGGSHKYLYPSAGALNAVRTYVAVKTAGVTGLPVGIYYYHPEHNALYRVGGVDGLSRSVFNEVDQIAVDSAAFAVFFIGKLDAIAPIYQQVSSQLITLEAGYMGQLLLSRGAEYQLGVSPVAAVDFDRVKGLFDLSGDERFIHCLLAGKKDSNFHPSAENSLPDHLSPAQSSRSHRNRAQDGASSCLSHNSAESWLETPALTDEIIDALHGDRRNLRDVNNISEVYRLTDRSFSSDEYRLRSCKRDFDNKPVRMDALSRLLALCQVRVHNGNPYHLYGSATGEYGLEIYLYVRGESVEGLSEGTYAYDATRHTLQRMRPLPAAQMEKAFTPFNRKIYKKAAFCLFIVRREFEAFTKDEAIHLPLLNAGYLGQLFLEHQAEFGLGLCPIGGLRFEPLRKAFGLTDGIALVHSFLGGAFTQERQFDRDLLETGPALSHLRTGTAEPSQPIAIVGLEGRYPGAESLDELWENLKGGISSIREAPEARRELLAQTVVDGVCRGAFLEDVECFDSLLFGISPAEARVLDPQERLLLECSWACMEDAGYTAQAFADEEQRVGVFIGAMWNDYQSHGVQVWQAQGSAEEYSHHSSLANRISYVFNFTGPSIAVNTSCSSGMTALHLAIESIKRGECDAALVGGINLISHIYHTELLASLGFISKEGIPKPFSALADGWVPGEGVGAVLLKPLSKAQKDNDHIYGLIKGTVIGHSGRTVRFGAPNWQRQAQFIRKVLSNADVEPRHVSYVEAAAPGASLADAAEIAAIEDVFGCRDRKQTCYIGTVKANIGHLESASVFSQLTKVLWQFRHKQLVPSLHLRPQNPLISLDESGLSFVEQLMPWDVSQASNDERRRLALINVTGAAGSEGHLIVEEYVAPPRVHLSTRLLVVPLSAATEAQLTEQAAQLCEFLSEWPDTVLDDIAYTLGVGRVPMTERMALVVRDTKALHERLAAYLAGAPENSSFYRGRAIAPSILPPGAVDPHMLASAWVLGAPVEWGTLFDSQPHRISLPTYPFERAQHWLRRTFSPNPDNNDQLRELSDIVIVQRGQEQIHAKMLDYVSRLLADTTEIPLSRIDADAPLDTFGLNSAIVVKLSERLETVFNPIAKTLFFEHRTLRDLVVYLIEHHANAVSGLIGIGVKLDPPRQKDSRQIESRQTERAPRQMADRESEIAIIGLGCRYPDAWTCDQFWANLKSGVDSVTEIPAERWDHSEYFDPEKGKPGMSYSKWGGFIDEVDRFDPLFFNISPHEADIMDPRERLFLENVWKLLEGAGHTRASLHQRYRGQIGVYVGASGGDIATIANRTSYYFGLEGPSIAIDTMCSSSAMAIHLACRALLHGECELAIAGGVNLAVHPRKYVDLSQLQMIGSHPNSRSFGDGDGFLPAEGVGTVLLKPLAKAVQDGDAIHAVIKATATKHSGRSNGYSVPNLNLQAEVAEESLRQAGIDPRTLSYVEAAANGSALGDPIEVAALTKVLNKAGAGKQSCALGSVKSNLGHPEAASGVAQLTKVVLQLQHQQLAPSIKAEPLNPNLRLDETPFALQTELADWHRPILEIDGKLQEVPRRALIDSYGAGGTYVSLVVEEYARAQAAIAERPDKHDAPQLCIFSARNADRLQALVGQMLLYVEQQKELELSDLAYTLQVAREAMEIRLALVVRNQKELVEGLTAYLAASKGKDVSPPLTLFTGDIHDSPLQFRQFLQGELGNSIVQTLVTTRDLEKLAIYWIQGGSVPWPDLHDPENVRKIALPTYPFARQKFKVLGRALDGHATTHSAQVNELVATPPEANRSIDERLRAFIVRALGEALKITPDQIKLARPMRDYGLDSVHGMKLMRQLERNFNVTVTGRELLEYPTIDALTKFLAKKAISKGELLPEPSSPSLTENEPQSAEEPDMPDQNLLSVFEKFRCGDLSIEEAEQLIREGL